MQDIGKVEEQWDNTPATMKEKRGNMLSIITVLSWVSQGSTAASTLLTMSRGDEAMLEQIQMIEEVTDKQQIDVPFLSNLMNDSVEMMVILYNNFYQFNLMNLLIVATGALGVLLMYKLKKVGFFIYLIYCSAEIYAFYHFFGALSFAPYAMATTGIISIVFIILYVVNLKRMTE